MLVINIYYYICINRTIKQLEMATMLNNYKQLIEVVKQSRKHMAIFEREKMQDEYYGAKTTMETALMLMEDYPKVNVKFYVGYMTKYRAVTKIGKTYFDGCEKMTQKNGYRSIQEIEEITDKMHAEMIADSYHY